MRKAPRNSGLLSVGIALGGEEEEGGRRDFSWISTYLGSFGDTFTEYLDFQIAEVRM